MLGYESERRLKNLLVAIGDGERDLEGARQRLCSIRDFAPHSGFQRLDRDYSTQISSHEIVNFLRDNSVYHVLESEAYNLVQFFDSNGNGRLSFQEFLQMVLPCEDNLLRNMTLDRPSARIGRYDHLPRDIELALLLPLSSRRRSTFKEDLRFSRESSRFNTTTPHSLPSDQSIDTTAEDSTPLMLELSSDKTDITPLRWNSLPLLEELTLMETPA